MRDTLIESLPVEIIELIIRMLPVKDLINLSITNKFFLNFPLLVTFKLLHHVSLCEEDKIIKTVKAVVEKQELYGDVLTKQIFLFTDYSGITYKNVTVLKFLLWTLDQQTLGLIGHENAASLDALAGNGSVTINNYSGILKIFADNQGDWLAILYSQYVYLKNEGLTYTVNGVLKTSVYADIEEYLNVCKKFDDYSKLNRVINNRPSKEACDFWWEISKLQFLIPAWFKKMYQGQLSLEDHSALINPKYKSCISTQTKIQPDEFAKSKVIVRSIQNIGTSICGGGHITIFNNAMTMKKVFETRKSQADNFKRVVA